MALALLNNAPATVQGAVVLLYGITVCCIAFAAAFSRAATQRRAAREVLYRLLLRQPR